MSSLFACFMAETWRDKGTQAGRQAGRQAGTHARTHARAHTHTHTNVHARTHIRAPTTNNARDGGIIKQKQQDTLISTCLKYAP